MRMRILELRKKTTEILIHGREVLSVCVLSGSAEAAREADRREARRARGHPVRGGAEEQTQVSPLYTSQHWSMVTY